jgi:hypothetical protein
MKHHSEIQAILFDRHFYTKEQAEEYLNKHDYHPIKEIHQTENRLRARLVDPRNFSHFIIHKIPHHVEFVIGFYEDA